MKFIEVALAVVLSLIPLYSNAKDNECPVDWRMGAKRVPKESIASDMQIIELARFIRESVVLSEFEVDVDKIISGLNSLLETEGLPLITTDYKFEYVYYNLFRDSQKFGVDIRTSDITFCFPCQTGHNDFMVGIFPRGVEVTEPRNGPGICEVWQKNGNKD